MAVTGDVAITLPLIEVELLGGALIESELPIITVAATGSVGTTVSSSVELPMLTVDITGSVNHPSDIAVTLPIITVALTMADQPDSDVAVTLPIITARIEAIIGGSCEIYMMQYADVFDNKTDIAITLPLIEVEITET